ncbi:AEC family transporter [Actinomyces oris]|uniref:AEC family transporter n=1 Tax=Actinomyces TaxID=1654 RepID=UPI0008071227|nr:AEC family transporter [Actinomyces oris]OBY95014.1 transporter [Actinomyces oris]
MADVVAGLAVFGAVIAVGWLLVRTRAVPADADGVLTRVCFFAATPALLVTTLSRADLTAVLSRSTAVAVAAELAAIVSAWCLHRLVLRRPTAEATIGALASGYVNAANLGIPVAVLVLGDAATIAPILLLQLLVLTPATFTVLDAVTRRGNPSRLATLTVPLRNPLLWGVVAGTAANLGGVDLKEWGGGYPAQGLEMLGRVAVPLMMLALGMSLAGAPRPLRNLVPEEAAPSLQGSPARTVQSPQSARQSQEPLAAEAGSEAHEINTAGGRLPRVEEEPAHGARSTSQRGAGRRRDLWLAVGWKLAVMPGLAVVVGLAAGLSGGQLLAPVVTAALPTAQNVFMYASRYGAVKDLARDAVLLTTAGFVPVVLLAAALLH